MKKIILLFFAILSFIIGYSQTTTTQSTGGQTGGSGGSSVTSSYTLTIAATTTVTGSATSYSRQAYASSNATSWTMVYSSIGDGSKVVIDYKKTTASNLILTFPVGTVISTHSDVSNITSPTCTLVSTVNGRYRIIIENIHSIYFATIIQDIQ